MGVDNIVHKQFSVHQIIGYSNLIPISNKHKRTTNNTSKSTNSVYKNLNQLQLEIKRNKEDKLSCRQVASSLLSPSHHHNQENHNGENNRIFQLLREGKLGGFFVVCRHKQLSKNHRKCLNHLHALCCSIIK